MAEEQTVTVSVRKGLADGERWLSFSLPETIEPEELLERDCAIDGNQAVCSIVRNTAADASAWFYPTLKSPPTRPGIFGPADQPWADAPSLPEALCEAELALSRFLNKRGYGVTFR